MNRVYIGNLSYWATNESIQAAFRSEGINPLDIEIIVDKASGRARGYAFVQLSNETDFKLALEKLPGCPIENRPIIIRPATERVSRPNNTLRKIKQDPNHQISND